MAKKKKKGFSADSPSKISTRKADHVELVATEDVSYRDIRTGFDLLRFEHNALPELSLDDVDSSTTFLGKPLDAPILISSMTGGYAEAEKINAALARTAKQFGLAIGIGSARQALESKQYHKSFSVVRKEHPHGLIFTNIGGAEIAALHAKGKITSLKKIIDLVKADGIIVHLNPLQELMQPEGSRDFRGVLSAIDALCHQFRIPVIVKEVGAGISRATAERLINVGVRVIDVAGSGGTSWSGVEILRQKKNERAALDPFWDWGIPTVEALRAVKELKQTMTFGLIASGGIRSGVDIAKSITLGADLAGIAQPLMKAFYEGGEELLVDYVTTLIMQLKTAMLLTGSKTIGDLSGQTLFQIP